MQGSLAFAHQNSTDLWTFSSRRFFPLDKKGWQTNSSTSHNYHFTMEMHLDIKYNGGEKFTFRGDDDVWVFINNKLAIDIGGVHGPVQRTVDLDTLGLKKGSRYPLDLFYAERKCCGSHILISTTLDFEEAKPYQRTPENTLQEIDVEEVEIEKVRDLQTSPLCSPPPPHPPRSPSLVTHTLPCNLSLDMTPPSPLL